MNVALCLFLNTGEKAQCWQGQSILQFLGSGHTKTQQTVFNLSTLELQQQLFDHR